MAHRRRDDEQCPPRAVNLGRSDRSHLHQHMICRGGPRDRRHGLRGTCHLTSVHRDVVLQALIAAWSLPGEGEGLGIVVGQAQIRHRRGHRARTGRRTRRPCRCAHRGGGRHGTLRWSSGVLAQGDDGCDHPEEGDPSRRCSHGSRHHAPSLGDVGSLHSTMARPSPLSQHGTSGAETCAVARSRGQALSRRARTIRGRGMIRIPPPPRCTHRAAPLATASTRTTL